MVSNLGKNIAKDRKDAREEGIKEGKREEKLEVARKLKFLGIDIGKIIEATGLSREVIDNLKE